METTTVEASTFVRAGNIIKEFHLIKDRKRLADYNDLMDKSRSGKPIKNRPGKSRQP
ncbi:Hypothetical protein FKW44_013301 [Caligus rogercresseyi]|uniref:Uncharacterized protein n=1 Tax=Caligus rogercresseyi TaxID=217165 RepID=A0A7T8KB79_CALRO|nr:Hypothetical protein FKW44_013301 [Caligus rogercresseyi]